MSSSFRVTRSTPVDRIQVRNCRTLFSSTRQACGSAAFTASLNPSRNDSDPAPIVSSTETRGTAPNISLARESSSPAPKWCVAIPAVSLPGETGARCNEPASTFAAQSMKMTASAWATSSASSGVHCCRLNTRTQPSLANCFSAHLASHGPTPSSSRSVFPQASMRHLAGIGFIS